MNIYTKYAIIFLRITDNYQVVFFHLQRNILNGRQLEEKLSFLFVLKIFRTRPNNTGGGKKYYYKEQRKDG